MEWMNKFDKMGRTGLAALKGRHAEPLCLILWHILYSSGSIQGVTVAYCDMESKPYTE